MWEAHNWKRSDRLWFGLYTLLPVVVGLALVIDFLRDPDQGFGFMGEGEGPCVLCIAHPLMVFMLLMIYAPAAFNNQRITRPVRRLWIVGFVLAGIVTLPVYWYRHVWLAPYEPDEEEG